MTERRPLAQQPLFVSGNAGKAREVAAILGFTLERLEADVPEIQTLDVAEVVREKAQAAYALAGRPVLVEDTGLYLAALNGLPGALVKWFVSTVGPAGICAMLPPGAPRAAIARTAVALHDGDDVLVLTGEVPGQITLAPRGEHGFGWDPIFLPDGAPGTFAEMAQAEKNRYSMRRLALEQLRERLLLAEPDDNRG
ncbi:MAG: non-canonical purine NTP pyrophosphatase [Thermomicrobiales bacterium]